MELKRETFNLLMKFMDEKEKELLIELEKIDFRGIMYNIVDGLLKVQKLGKVKQAKKLKQLVNRTKKQLKVIKQHITPTETTFVFHLLMEANDRLNNLINHKTKLIELTAKRINLPYEEVEKQFHYIDLDVNFEITAKIEKRIKNNDSRVSKLLDKLVIKNDSIINKDTLHQLMFNSRQSFKIENNEVKDYLVDNIEFIKVIKQDLEVVKYTLSEVKENIKYTKEEIKQIRYNITIMSKIVDELEAEIQIENKLGKYKDLVMRSLKLEGENLYSGVVTSYLEYLVWLESKNRLNEEYELLKELEEVA